MKCHKTTQLATFSSTPRSLLKGGRSLSYIKNLKKLLNFNKNSIASYCGQPPAAQLAACRSIRTYRSHTPQLLKVFVNIDTILGFKEIPQ